MNELLLNEPASTKAIRNFYKQCSETCMKYGIDFKYLCTCAESLKDDYPKYSSIIHEALKEAFPRIADYVQRKAGNSPQILESNIRNIGNMLDAIFTYKNNTRFIFESNCDTAEQFLGLYELPGHIEAYDFFEYADDLPDMLLDIKLNNKYLNVVYRLTKAQYTMDYRDKTDLPIYNLTCLVNSKESSYVAAQFAIVKGIFPKLLMDPFCTTGTCAEGSYCKRSVRVQVEEKGVGQLEMEHAYCYMTPKKMKEYACEFAVLKPYEIVKIMVYVNDMFNNRHTLERKNSKRRHDYSKHTIATPTIDVDGKERILELRDYYRYEKTHKEWQGGHHKSPVEHVRREHVRHIYNKDGSLKKIVPVKSSVVNSGGAKVIYKVKDKTD